jgi:2-polyprenyl-3-methyl-5-hydroxy-6-metoxy-1,4-benzoquinol methylase
MADRPARPRRREAEAVSLLSLIYDRAPRDWVQAVRGGPHAAFLDVTRYEALLASLRQRFARYRTEHLRATTAEAFRRHLEAQLGVIDHDIEGYTPAELERQRDLSVRFLWGHDHDFGEFSLEGRMKCRHLEVLARFCTLFDMSLDDFVGRHVFDIGCWTGGTTLALASLGAKVTAIEEVRKYAHMAQFLSESFGLADRVSVSPISIYDCNRKEWHDAFDLVYCPGVIYHLSDPVLALRILFNSLKPGGIILVESAGIDRAEPACLFAGSRSHSGGAAVELTRGGWNWFLPSASALKSMMQEAGFDSIRSVALRQGVWDFAPGRRLYACGIKTRQVGICKAGLSVPGIR